MIARIEVNGEFSEYEFGGAVSFSGLNNTKPDGKNFDELVDARKCKNCGTGDELYYEGLCYTCYRNYYYGG